MASKEEMRKLRFVSNPADFIITRANDVEADKKLAEENPEKAKEL